MRTDSVNLHWLWRETVNRLDVLARRVSENRDVLGASEFCRWLLFSGLIQFFKENSQPEPLKVDGAFVEWKIKELLYQCNERFRTGKTEPTIAESELKSIHEKMDLIAGYLSKLTAAPAGKVGNGSGLKEDLNGSEEPVQVIESRLTFDEARSGLVKLPSDN